MATGLQINGKRSKLLPLWIALAVCSLILIAFGFYCYRYYTTGEKLPVPIPMPIASANSDVSETPITQQQVAQHEVAPDKPRYLSIAVLGIDKARVLPIGVTESNELDTPSNIHDVGWYEKSASPGDGAPAVLIDGHNGGPTMGGVFQNLGNMNVGDEITMQRGDGNEFTYVVQENKSISLEELNNGVMQEMASSIDSRAQGLNIISCTGNWIPQKQTYDSRQVVRAVLKD